MVRVVKYEIRYNRRNKRHVVFKVPDKGLWRIVKGGSFKTRKEATDWVKAKTK